MAYQETLRTEQSMLDDGINTVPHYNINNIPTEQFDLGIVIVPKSNPNINLDSFRSCCKKVTIWQKASLVFPRLYDRTTISLLQYNSIG